jgi:hypothetical protein
MLVGLYDGVSTIDLTVLFDIGGPKQPKKHRSKAIFRRRFFSDGNQPTPVQSSGLTPMRGTVALTVLVRYRNSKWIGLTKL